MVSFEKDEYVDPLHPVRDIEKLALLLSLLCGQEINPKNLCSEAKLAINSFLKTVKKKRGKVRLSYEEFNELLLLFNQHRVERPFFDFFFLEKDLQPKYISMKIRRANKSSIYFDQLTSGVKRFRGFALLCFGNFRFAFRTLSEEKKPIKFICSLDPWIRNSSIEKKRLNDRREPLVPLTDTKDQLKENDTWFLGYLSTDKLSSDGVALREKTIKALKDSTSKSKKKVMMLIRKSKRLKPLISQFLQLSQNLNEAIGKGKRNSIKYLTWDFLDVYVATSMRQKWEFEETHKFIKDVFTKKLKVLPKIRWFDPTQSYYESTIDKGLLEGLMLKRAKCTIYMAQEGDTLGKDSELAATLAQGKPVIAYVPKKTHGELPGFARELKNRPPRYFRQRLLILLADGFFDKRDNLIEVSKLAKKLKYSVSQENVKKEVIKLLMLFGKFEDKRTFQIIGDDEETFRREHGKEIKSAIKLIAAIECKAADNRADTIKHKHPLGIQVHLESGVANGVLVVRCAKECADLVKGVLLRNLSFDMIKKVNKEGNEIATALLERKTKSLFRVVTKDECLTNSFWNFYLTTERPKLGNAKEV